MYTQKGFNLVELALVLIIIGLLLGAILKGQALIDNAKLKRTQQDIAALSAAVTAYIDRYHTLPGDDNEACRRWGTSCSGQPILRDVPDGNKDGIISGAWNTVTKGSASVTNESYILWIHLFKAGLVNSAHNPPNAFGGLFGIEEGAHVNNSENSGTVNIGMTQLLLCWDKVPGDMAEILDLKLDDGHGNSGQLRAFIGNAIGSDMSALAASYDPQKNYVLCQALF
jgi:prepilin-type N-terminal cleavage/methylation domain-containing protein